MATKKWITVTKAGPLIYWHCPGGCKEIQWSNEIIFGKVCKQCNINYVALKLQSNRLLIEVFYENNNE